MSIKIKTPNPYVKLTEISVDIEALEIIANTPGVPMDKRLVAKQRARKLLEQYNELKKELGNK